MVYNGVMTTKSEVVRKAKTQQCEFVVDGNYVDLVPPRGFRLGEYHTVLRESTPGYLTKSEIYEELLDLLDDLTPCPADCENCE